MSAYTGYLIRSERLNRNLSQEGLAKGICAPSYLSKIEKGLVEPGREIIDRLFETLGVAFVRDEALMREAERRLEAYFFYADAGEPCSEAEAFFLEQGGRLERSEFALSYAVYRLYRAAEKQAWEEAREAEKRLEPFFGCLNAPLRQRALIAQAKMEKNPEYAARLLEEAAALLPSCVALYRRAECFYWLGQYGRSEELAGRAYALACEQGNPHIMIWSSYLLGSCACNRYDLREAQQQYERARALTRGYREDVTDYAAYNLGSTYLELGDAQRALGYLTAAREMEKDPWHNALLHQKLAIVHLEAGSREEAERHMERAKACAEEIVHASERELEMLGGMLRFAQLFFDPQCCELPEYEQVLTYLYDEAGQALGHGFRQFYGRYLMKLYKRQRRYKDALRVSEALGMDILSSK
ncbi:MAG: helix-turn-helix domain-containing protein [Clostridia bacterium]|nr:helix-turn-helix domain-containing protein [Clostridia bacterium]